MSAPVSSPSIPPNDASRPAEAGKAGASALGDPALRAELEAFVRRRARGADVDDVVQTVLCEALASPRTPDDRQELVRYLLGIARHKVADQYRRAAREPGAELPELVAPDDPVEAREMVRWAEAQAFSVRGAEPRQTLDWMAREGEGEKLEAIAAEARLPAARVRQRVSRMRRQMKERWAAELALVAALGMVALVAWRLLRPWPLPEIALPDPLPAPSGAPLLGPDPESPLERARALRDEAFGLCGRGELAACLERLDRARSLDVAGEADPRVSAARREAERALQAPAPEPPASSAAPKPSPPTKVRPPPPRAPNTASLSKPSKAPVAPKKGAPKGEPELYRQKGELRAPRN